MEEQARAAGNTVEHNILPSRGRLKHASSASGSTLALPTGYPRIKVLTTVRISYWERKKYSNFLLSYLWVTESLLLSI